MICTDRSITFLKSIKLIYYVQIVTGTSRWFIRDKSVYSRVAVQKCWLTIWLLACLFLFYESWHTFSSEQSDRITKLILKSIHKATYLIHIINLTLTSKHGVVLLKLCRNLFKFHWSLTIWKTFYSDLAVLGLFIFFALKLVTNSIAGCDLDGYFNIITYFVFEIDILLWAKICSYLRLSFQNINYSLKEITNTHHNIIKSKYHTSKLHNILLAIERTLCSFEILTKTHKCVLFLFYTNFFIWTISYIKIITTLTDNRSKPEEYYVIVVSFVEKMAILFVVSINAELLKKEVECAQNSCIGILSSHENGVLTEWAEKILWLIREIMPNFTIYGLLQIGYKLPFQFLSLVLVYAVALLQFIIL